jgi:hypothetical protein
LHHSTVRESLFSGSGVGKLAQRFTSRDKASVLKRQFVAVVFGFAQVFLKLVALGLVSLAGFPEVKVRIVTLLRYASDFALQQANVGKQHEFDFFAHLSHLRAAHS